MKPQDSKDTAAHASQMTESDNENESLESLIARLEQLNAPQKKRAP